jgi:hypothetical protein
VAVTRGVPFMAKKRRVVRGRYEITINVIKLRAFDSRRDAEAQRITEN